MTTPGGTTVTLASWLETRATRLPGGTGAILLDDARREVEGFLRPVTARALDDAARRSVDVSRYRVHERGLYRARREAPDKPWFEAAEARFEGMLQRLLGLVPPEVGMPDFDFAVNLGDHPVKGAPILTAWSREGFGNARIPSVVHWPTDLSVELDDPRIRAHYAFDEEAVARPWKERLPRVAWRGSATGMYERTFRWSRLAAVFGVPLGRGVPRLDLCRIAASNPTRIDARITGWPQVSDALRARLEAAFPTAPRVPNSWFLEHRFVMNVDGNVATTSFLTFVGSGSVVLKQDSPYRDWCARHLEAGEHYLAVRRDLGDLAMVADRALEDDAEAHARAERVVQAGRRFAHRFLTGAAIDLYLLALLERYARASGAAASPGLSAAAEPPGRGFVRVT